MEIPIIPIDRTPKNSSNIFILAIQDKASESNLGRNRRLVQAWPIAVRHFRVHAQHEAHRSSATIRNRVQEQSSTTAIRRFCGETAFHTRTHKHKTVSQFCSSTLANGRRRGTQLKKLRSRAQALRLALKINTAAAATATSLVAVAATAATQTTRKTTPAGITLARRAMLVRKRIDSTAHQSSIANATSINFGFVADCSQGRTSSTLTAWGRNRTVPSCIIR